MKSKEKNKMYNAVLNLVKLGFTIQESCKYFGFSSSKLYRNITGQQKAELISYKIIGIGSPNEFQNKMDNYMLRCD